MADDTVHLLDQVTLLTLPMGMAKLGSLQAKALHEQCARSAFRQGAPAESGHGQESSLSADIQRALGQLTSAPAASGAGSASPPAAGEGLGTNATSADARAFLPTQI